MDKNRHMTGPASARRGSNGEARRRKLLSRLEERLREEHNILDKIDVDEIVDLVRRDRESR